MEIVQVFGERKVRQSNLEILRIVSMVLIVMSHCDDIFGLYELYSTSLGINKIITDWLHIGGQIGVGCFLLISGYFMVEQNISAKKLLKIASEVWFYTIGIWISWIICNIYQGQFNIKEWLVEGIYAFFPILFRHYWFVTAYIILMIMSPFLNKFIFSLDYQYYQKFLCSLLIIFVVLKGGIPGILPEMTKGRLMPVFVMYFIAGYLRRFCNIKKKNSKRHFAIAIIVYFLLFATFYGITYLGMVFHSQKIMDNRYFYRGLNSPFIVVICLELFVGFLKLDIKFNKVINEIASCTFGVFLLHSNRLMEGYLSKLFPVYRETNPFLIFVYSLISVFAIYVVGTLIDYIRKNSIERIWMMLLGKYLGSILNKFREALNWSSDFAIKWFDRFYNKR